MSEIILIFIILAYLGFLFLIAYWAEKNNRSKWVNNPYVYALSLAVYCSAWTYYGSVGVAARTGAEFLTIYLGPVIAAPLWIILLRKIIQLSKLFNISSIADFISLRYGNNRSLGAIVTLICAASIIPYISLQLKAISETFELVSSNNSIENATLFSDSTFYIAVLLATFAAFFGTLSLDASKNRKGLIFSVAFESILKLAFFLLIGIYVSFFLFDSPQDIYNQADALFGIESKSGIPNAQNGINWYFTIVLSFLAIFLLPRQFQTSVVEYSERIQLKKAIWVFPLYLLLFNVFVIFIAWGGLILLGEEVNADYFTLLIPLSQGNTLIAILVFLGGFSAVISMVVVSTLALSTMLSNNLIIPYGFIETFSRNASVKNEKIIKNIRRISIFVSILLAYLLYRLFDPKVSLFSIGLISFLIIVQLAPSFFIGMFWNRGSSKGAKYGMIAGSLVVIYTYLVPFLAEGVFHTTSLIENGPWGIQVLNPYHLFGMEVLNPVNHSLYWSLFINLGLYATLSVNQKGDYRERNYGEMFVNSEQLVEMKETAYVWKGEAYVADIFALLIKFIGQDRAEKALRVFRKRYGVNPEEKLADARFINFSERLLTGAVGSASAKILISNVAKEKPVSLVEVLKILEENKEAISVSKSLEEQSKKLMKLTQELSLANQELQQQDKLKDDFLDTVAHELKTPITSIQASGEILLEDEELPMALKKQFLANILTDTERLTLLINDILNLEKLSTGRETVHLELTSMNDLLRNAIRGIESISAKKEISIHKNFNLPSMYIDRDKMMQVITNILSNALKFIDEKTGVIEIKSSETEEHWIIDVVDNGKGIPKEDIPHIFKKFYQSQQQTLKKPEGSGFGLAICKQIVTLHRGNIYALEGIKTGACIRIELPKSEAISP